MNAGIRSFLVLVRPGSMVMADRMALPADRVKPADRVLRPGPLTEGGRPGETYGMATRRPGPAEENDVPS
jgi:hypothetical protein